MPAPDEPQQPPDWDVDVVASDGGIVRFRPIRPDDGDGLLALSERSSDETLYLRFFSYRRSITPAELDRLVTVDYVDRLALVAEIGGQVVGVGRYDKVEQGEAEVAFLVEDAHQHRGLGTLLLEHLAVLARRNGFDRFTAITLAENRSMLGVFRAAGFRAKRRFEDGAYRIDFPIDHIDPEPLFRREQQADVASIAAVLRPAAVAVFGASLHGGGHGNHILRQLRAGGYTGEVVVVHPAGGSIDGVEAHRSIAEVPERVDLAVLAVPPDQVEELLPELGEAGVRAVLAITSGFAEQGPAGAERLGSLAATARRGGLRLVGPNSLGVIENDPAVGLAATFTPVLPTKGSLALLSQSGMVGAAALERANELELGLSAFVSVGDKADVSGNDLLQYWEQDTRTRVIGLYLESFGNPRRFSRIARRVGRTKPIITVKSGASLETDELAEEVVDALVRQAGIVRVRSLQELLDTAKVLVDCPLPLGPRVQVVANVGGAGTLSADACAQAGLELARLGDDTLDRLGELGVVPGPAGRPVLLPVQADRATWTDALRSVLADDAVDAVVVSYHSVLATPADEIAEAIGQAAADAEGKPLLASIPSRAIDVRTIVSPAGDVHVPVFPFPESPVSALALAHRYATWRLHRVGEFPEASEELLDLADEAWAWAGDEPRSADPDETGQLLQAAGIELSIDAPDQSSYAVRLGIHQHPAFGPMVSARLEAVDGSVAGRTGYRLAPLTDHDAASLLRHLPGSSDLSDPLHADHRDDLVDLVMRVGLLASEVEAIGSADLGPVHVGTHGSGVLAARIELRPGDAAHDLPVRRL